MTTYFIEFVEYYEQFKINRKKEIYTDDEIPEDVKNIYSPENDCMIIVFGIITHYKLNKYDIMNFFVNICNDNKFNTSEEINKFINFITKNNGEKYFEKSILKDIVCLTKNDILTKRKNITDDKLYHLFMHALFEKIPINILNNTIIQKLIKNIMVAYPEDINNVLKFIVFINKRGFEFDEKTIKLLKKSKFDIGLIKSNDINVNIKKYNSFEYYSSIIKDDFNQCKQKFYDSLKDNNILNDNICNIFNEIDNMIFDIYELKDIQNHIKLKLYYDMKINEMDIYLLSYYSLTEKIDENLIKDIQEDFDKNKYELDFDKLKIMDYLKKTNNICGKTIYDYKRDDRYNFREIFENILAMNFKIKLYDYDKLKNLFIVFNKHIENFIHNNDKLCEKIKNNYKITEEQKQYLLQEYIQQKDIFLNSIKDFDIINKIYNGIYDKKFIKLILYDYHYIFPSMIQSKPELIKLIDHDIITIIFALNYSQCFLALYNNKMLIDNDYTEYITYTDSIEMFLTEIYNCNMRLTEKAYYQISSLIPKTKLKTLNLKSYLMDKDMKPKISVSEIINKLSFNEQIEYFHNNFNDLNIDDILNIKDNNAKIYILKYISNVMKQNKFDNKIDEKPKKIIKVVKKIVKKKEENIN